MGDIVHLAAGDIVPADLRMVAARDLFVGQSALTGESEAVEKLAAPTEGLVPTLEAANLAFLGTTVISGTGVGVTVRVGEQTELGNIAARLDASGKQTAYDRGIRDVSLLLVRLMLVVVPIVFGINVFTKGNWLDALLFLNFVYDLTCIAMPWDNVDEDTLRQPRAWDSGSISSFMRWMGPISSVFDIVTFALLFMVVCPAVCGGTWQQLLPADQLRFAATFQAGWLIESMVTQVLAVQLLRTEHLPFVESHASWQISALGVAGIAVAAIMCCTSLGHVIDLAVLPFGAVAMLTLVVVAYGLCVLAVRKAYSTRYGSLL